MVKSTSPPTKRQSNAASRAEATAVSELAVKSWLSVVRAYNLCDALMAHRLAPLGLRTSEHEILLNLHREPGLTQQALAERCFTAKSHMSALLSHMQANAWLKRENHPQDARAKCLYLLPHGQALALRSMRVQQDIVHIMAESLDSIQLEQVRSAMLPVQQALEQALGTGEL